ncbi:hypothetical protein N7474_008366 [Penicillium riverlandense]|uniref:uncharacterized protein n=1 Tax=Penicillium riverlandense TaxID=1903569 RepID=UPI0025482456|nr:uncharacterized protein N7474_008366 [Penicillium riverlandense]KAJ5812065.1 hypothetical protein N7474_008366 [Penicillium riverlandense]
MSVAYHGLCRHFFLLGLSLLTLLLPGEAYESVSDETLRSLPRPGNDFDINNGALLSPILIPRVPGTPGSTAVLNHFVDFFQTTLPEWKIEFQNSTSTTPTSNGKDVPFVNFIASRDPPGTSPGDVEYVTFVAHYDSKLEPEGFIGAIDSAAPCAIIMHMMRSIDTALGNKWDAMQGRKASSLDLKWGIQVIFLDGEEAFKSWTDEDSLYGARSLAEQWETQMHPAMSDFRTPLSAISLFVLLDLLGAQGPSILSYYQTTHWAYKHLASLEQRLRSLDMFKSSPGASWFPDAAKDEHELKAFGGIQDDHIPFLARGVEILHLIDFTPMRKTGFQPVWHTIDDDGEHLDINTVEDWSMLMTAFAAEWMDLEGYFDTVDGPTQRDEALANAEATGLDKRDEL